MRPNTRAGEADPGSMPLVAAAATGAAGLAVTVLAGQFLFRIALAPGELAVVVGLLTGGLLLLVAARGLLDARPWAACLASLVAPVLTLVTTVWSLYALWSGTYAVYLFFAPPVCAVVALVSPFAIAPSIRSSRARATFRSGALLGAIDR